MKQLIEALQSHEDSGNKMIAGKLRNAYSQSEQPLQPEYPNPDITADMPSLTVHAGPKEYPINLYSTDPNIFECVIPERIIMSEAENEYQFVVNYGNTSVTVTFSLANSSSKYT